MIECGDVALGLGQEVHGQEPARQAQLGGLEVRAAGDAALVTAGFALEVQPTFAAKRTAGTAAARQAGKIRGPARFDRATLRLSLRPDRQGESAEVRR